MVEVTPDRRRLKFGAMTSTVLASTSAILASFAGQKRQQGVHRLVQLIRLPRDECLGGIAGGLEDLRLLQPLAET